ncbi:MAG: COX15/CtaA family protein [Acidobacteria bacterium]|nr:COX15/CtaA family protein [Acidobacteriota bacterium]
MNERAGTFAKLAWAVLGWNVLVVVWGALVRASGSGAGCGSHWPLCNGAVIPPSPTVQTVIEFTHRLTSGLALVGVGALVVLSRKWFEKGHGARKWAWASLIFIVVEALLGAGLVLLSYVEKNASAGRAVYLCMHLTNTLLLLGTIQGAAWSAGGGRFGWGRVPGLIQGALGAALVASLTGAIAALGDTIYPATSMLEGVKQEFAEAAPALLRLRLAHPLVAVLSGFFVLVAAFTKLKGGLKMRVAALTVAQLAAGAVNVLLLAPVWLQILHLALAVGIWLTLAYGALQEQD